jgi:hypothetical protein
MRARWKLGRLLAAMERQQVAGPGRGKQGGKTIYQLGKSFLEYIGGLGLNKNRAQDAQRIGALPEGESQTAARANRKKIPPRQTG